MPANQAACPPVGVLERLLAEDLRGPDRDSVESHVEACGPCQERLARLSAPSFPSAATESETGAGSGPEPDDGFLRRLRELSPDVGDGGGDRLLPGADAGRFPGGRLGRYQILEKLAAGGMGAVYKARHVELGKVVALKLLPAGDFSEVSLARFKNEMRAIGRLHHPHIVAAHDAGDVDGVHYLAMDFVDGVDLARLVERLGRLPVPDACEAVRQAALGLQHAFEKGLVHRDVKPSNLILARGGVVQVLDLGLARACEDAPSERLTSKGALLGTADYLAPEQWEHPHAADTRADIYGLGCTLYHLLAGRPPFDHVRNSALLARMRAHQEQPPPPITAARPDAPPGLAAVIGRMLAKDPAQRFQTPAEVAEALRPFAAGADLARLLDATATGPLPPAEAAVTPDPAALETATGSRKGRPAPARRYAVPAAVATLGLFLLATWFLWPRGGGTPSNPDVKPLTVSELGVTAYRDDGRTGLGDLKTGTVHVRVNDSVTVAADLSTPAYYYLIAFNPPGSKEGLEQLCQPADAEGVGARGTRPEKQAKVRYPPDGGLFAVDAAGLQVFVLAVSTKPLPTYDEWRAKAGDPPWPGVKDGGESKWHLKGTEFERLPIERGDVVGRPPKPLLELRDWFKERPEFEAVRIFAFPVVDKK